MHLLSPLLSFLTHPCLEQPPTLPSAAGGWGGAAALLTGSCPVCVPDLGKHTESGAQCRGVGLWVGALQHRRLQAASLGLSVYTRVLPPPPPPLLLSGALFLCVCSQFSIQGEVQTTSESRAPVSLTSPRSEAARILVKGTALSSHVLVAPLAARLCVRYLASDSSLLMWNGVFMAPTSEVEKIH